MLALQGMMWKEVEGDTMRLLAENSEQEGRKSGLSFGTEARDAIPSHAHKVSQ